MRQAIVIKNPKWEPFVTASDAFKKLEVKDKETAVLVVRGRAKEKRPTKIMKTFTKKSAVLPLIALLCLFGFAAQADQDITSSLAATTVATATTNSTAGATAFSLTVDQIAAVSVSIVGTNASPTNPVVVKFDTSLNGTDWYNDAYTWVFTPGGATATTAIMRLTNSVGGKYFRVGEIQNTNATSIFISRLIVEPKESRN